MTPPRIPRARFWAVPVGLLTLAAMALADEPSRRDDRDAKDQQAAGVIVKVEPCDPNDPSKGLRATINTAAVWRDYVRDTATEKGTTPEKAARKGDQSVATKGQPKAPETLVTIEINRDPAAVLRYRTTMDERSLGAPTPEAARKLTAADAPARAEEVGAAVKTVKPDGIKKGLFVHVRYHREGDCNLADRVIILEPVRDEKGP